MRTACRTPSSPRAAKGFIVYQKYPDDAWIDIEVFADRASADRYVKRLKAGPRPHRFGYAVLHRELTPNAARKVAQR